MKMYTAQIYNHLGVIDIEFTLVLLHGRENIKKYVTPQYLYSSVQICINKKVTVCVLNFLRLIFLPSSK